MSPLAEGEPNPLIALFRQCVVCITDEAGRFRGSGFFVAPGRVLTCGHVVHGDAALRVQWQDRAGPVDEIAAMPPLESVADPASYPLPDLAILGVKEAEEWGHPCAALTPGQPVLGGPASGLYLAGYTVEHSRVPALTGATTEFESLITEDGHTFFKLKRGLLLPGFSGSPLLDLHAGLVAGIVESSRGRAADLGGFAVPVTELAAAFPQVLEANDAFHRGDDRWRAAVEAEKIRAAERAGGRARLPLRRPVVALVPDEDVSAAKILRPRHAVVEYVGREQLLGDLAAWCEQEPGDGEFTGLWFVTGGGGFGKTRLAVEACREAEARGWTAGLLTPGVSESKLQALAEWPGRLLIAVDYAENTPDLIGRLAEELAARAPRPPVRVMVLVRRRASRADLLELFNGQREEQLDALLRQAPLSRLEDAESEIDRLELFRQAARDFAAFLGLPPPSGLRLPRLRATHFVRPLYVLAAAYLARASADADVDALSEADLLRALLAEHEAGHWDRWDQRRRLGLDPADQRAAVAVATLLTAEGEDEALTAARLIPHFGEEPESRLLAIARWLAQLYPSPGNQKLIIVPLEPDRLGEVLVGDVLNEHPELLAAAIDAASDRQLAEVLTVASRIAREDQAVDAQLRAALDERLADLFERGFTADGSDLLNAVITAMTTSRPVHGAAEAADRFPDALPVWLRPLAVTVTALAVDGLRARASDDPAAYLLDLAGFLGNLAYRLSEVGQRQEALEAARETVTIRRQLAQDSPAAYLPDLAASLNNLGNRLNGVGERQEALEAAREAVTHYRQLAQDSPAAYLPDLAASLSNLGNALSEVGERQEALEAAREAVTIRRQLAQDSPAAYLPGLAASLGNLGNRLSDVGQRQEALEAAREAVTHYRQLAQDSPAAYLPDLAASLGNLARSLNGVGERQEALEAAREAVTRYRQLAQDSPAAYLPDLAMSLSNLGNALGDVGQLQEALEAAREAVTIRRQLAQDDPAAYLPYLAASLNNLGNALGDVGERQEALEAAREAVTRYRQLAQDSPAAYLPDLAMSLSNLASFLGDVGQRQEALEAAREAVTIRRQLAQDSPAAYLPGLAASLGNLGNRLNGVGQRQEALEAARETVTHYRQLAQDSPAAYLPDLAMSLSNLASFLGDVGQRQEALEAAREAVTHYRHLAQDSPAAYLPGLAASLSNLGNALSEVGQRQEALEAAREAVTHYRHLAQDSPAAYLPDLAIPLGNLARFLSDAGRPNEAEELFSDILSAFPYGTGVGHMLLARGRWRAKQDRLTDAIADLTAALGAFERDGDRLARGRARQILRGLRGADNSAFDPAWEQLHEPLPVWLQHLVIHEGLADKIVAWIGAADWSASETYLEDNSATLLTDEAEATVEHLIDINPAADTLQEHLGLLKAARTYGVAAAYASHQEQLLTEHLIQILQQWLATRTWTESRAFVTAHSGDLLHSTTLAILDDLAEQDPADTVLRLHRGLLAYAATAGFDAAYDLLPDTTRQQQLLTDPATPADTRLALARLHSGQADDDPEAHFQLATATLLAILDQAAPLTPETAAPLAREAAAALADCASNAAPYEQRDFTHRLAQLGTEHPQLAPFTAGLQHILTSKPDVTRESSGQVRSAPSE